jgi:hypothetical protein
MSTPRACSLLKTGRSVRGTANGNCRLQRTHTFDPKRSLATDVEMTAFWSQMAVGSEPVNLTNDGVSASALDEHVR